MKKYSPLLLPIIICIAIAVTCKKEEVQKENDRAAEATAKPLIITKISATPQQKPVTFDHTSHKQRAGAQGKTCKSCHHKGKINDNCSNPTCHYGTGAEKFLHKKCYGECHRTAASAPKQSQCTGCHKQ
jgi:hypothetical protein